MNALQKIRQVHDDMPKQLGPKAQNDAWALVGRLLERLPGNKAEAARIVKERDLAGLDAFIRSLEHPGAKPAGVPAPGAKAADAAAPPRARRRVGRQRPRTRPARVSTSTKPDAGGASVAGARSGDGWAGVCDIRSS